MKFAGWLRRKFGAPGVSPTPDDPGLSTVVAAVDELARNYPAGAVVDPVAVAHRAGIDTVEAIAALQVLEERGQGQFIFRIVNGSGSEFARVRSLREIGNQVTNDFGETLTVMPENIDFAFAFSQHAGR